MHEGCGEQLRGVVRLLKDQVHHKPGAITWVELYGPGSYAGNEEQSERYAICHLSWHEGHKRYTGIRFEPASPLLKAFLGSFPTQHDSSNRQTS